ncbi:SDR family oxidoreductase [Rhodobacteraceae bacterium NNCM2]|nr:SDR family oxidoreductase [Coraliihabitans acroporae]
MTQGLEGKTIVITGAPGGIGSECAKLFVDAGCNLLLIDPREDALIAQKDELGGGDNIHIASSYLDSPEECAKALTAVSGPIHSLVHLAGIFVSDELKGDDRSKVFDPVIAANLTNAYDMAIACLERFDPDQVSRIVLTSSLAFRRGSPSHTAYSAAKGGIVGLTRSLAQRLAPKVLVNCVAPGLIETPMATNQPPEERERWLSRVSQIPLGRLGTARECATVIKFLCSEDANYVTSQTINIDGGLISS